MKIFLATGNKHKIEEITAIFKNVKKGSNIPFYIIIK